MTKRSVLSNCITNLQIKFLVFKQGPTQEDSTLCNTVLTLGNEPGNSIKIHEVEITLQVSLSFFDLYSAERLEK
jgi:hypothetical protein